MSPSRGAVTGGTTVRVTVRIPALRLYGFFSIPERSKLATAIVKIIGVKMMLIMMVMMKMMMKKMKMKIAAAMMLMEVMISCNPSFLAALAV